MGADTNLHKCILVQLGPTVNPSNDDSRLVCETFSFRRNVHHTPFCSAAVPLIRFFNFTTPIYCYEQERRGAWLSDMTWADLLQYYSCKQRWWSWWWSRNESFKSLLAKLWGGFLLLVVERMILWRKVAEFLRSFRDSHATWVICTSGHGKTASSSIFLQSLGHKNSIIASLRPTLSCLACGQGNLHKLFSVKFSLFLWLSDFMHRAPFVVVKAFSKKKWEREKGKFFFNFWRLSCPL